MRSFIVMAMFSASLAHSSWLNYEEVRELELDAAGLDEFFIDAGAGSMTVIGEPNTNLIRVTATVQVDESNDEKAREIIADHLTLTLDRKGERAVLKSFFNNDSWGSTDGSVALEVVMPAGIPLRVDDGSGSIVIENVSASVEVDDGSGSLKIYNVGALQIDDGSGSIDIDGANGDVEIIDGSGSITVRKVRGTVTIDDGSGSINVHDVEKDLIIIEDGSGGLSVSNIHGVVEQGT